MTSEGLTVVDDILPPSPASPSSTFHVQQQTPSLRAIRGQTQPFPASPSYAQVDEPPPGMSYVEYIRTWTDDHVARWLTEIKCTSYASIFRANDIRGDILLELDQVTLKEMGVSSVGDRLRIVNGVKALRQRALTRSTTPDPNRQGSDDSFQRTSRQNSEDVWDSPSSDDSSPAARSRRTDGGGNRPAPLQLESSGSQQDLSQPPDSAKLGTQTLPPPQAIRPLPQPHQSSSLHHSASNSSLHSNHSNSSSISSRSVLPPLPPAPRGPPPLPNQVRTPARNVYDQALRSSGRKTPTHGDLLTPATAGNSLLTPSTASTTHPNSSLLTPSTGSASTLSSGGSHSSFSSPEPRSGTSENRKPPGPRSPSPLTMNRPPPPRSSSTSIATPQSTPSPYQHGRRASAGSNSVTESPVSQSPGKIPLRSAAVAATASSLHNLSPINEAFSSNLRNNNGRLPHPPGTSTPSPPNTRTNTGTHYLPSLPSNYAAPIQNHHVATPSLDDLKRKHVKFIVPDVPGSSSITIDVTSCKSGHEVLEKALKKIGKAGSGLGPVRSRSLDEDGTTFTPDGGILIDGWAAYMREREDELGDPMSDVEILSVCAAPPSHPIRERGLLLRRNNNLLRRWDSPAVSSSPSRSAFSAISGASTGSPKTPGASPKQSSALRPRQQQQPRRASAYSILSGLGVKHPEQLQLALESPSPPASSSLSVYPPTPPPKRRPDPIGLLSPPASASASGSSSASFAPPSTSASDANAKRPSKLRNFFGQRPPSELISSHLQEFFPFTEKKVLERTKRQSMMSQRRSKRGTVMSVVGGGGGGRRDTTMSLLGVGSSSASYGRPLTFLEGRNKRKSVMISGPPAQAAAMKFPHDDREVQGDAYDGIGEDDLDMSFDDEVEREREPDNDEIVLGTDVPALGRSTSLKSKRATRMLNKPQDREREKERSLKSGLVDDMTVDEITAEVEHRRESMRKEKKSEEEDSEGEWTKVGAGESEGEEEDTLAGEESEELLEESEESTLMGEEEEGEKGEEEGEEGEPIKWIKGALIGAGSFGKVYLGMEASSGFLMAVKQVELPEESGPNEDHKKTMLTALEREIDLLRDLQHENIVQYYYSSMDDDYLNIFLEYVPGGSVTALLQNYGAFEEPLVKNFVRQILEGLNYLHERGIIHRDIKGGNILVDNKGGVKISDFGVSKKVESGTLMPTGKGGKNNRASLQGSVFWMAPEVVKQTVHTKKADIWSVGCLIIEMLTGEHPWGNISQMQAIFKIGSNAKPSIPSDISADAQDFLQKTFELDFQARPSAKELLSHPWVSKKPSPFFKAAKTVHAVEVSA